MKVFAVIAPGASEALNDAIARGFPGHHFVFGPGQYLVATAGMTPREVGAVIGDTGQVGSLLILPFENYWGWHNNEIWTWAQSRLQT